MGKKRGKNFFSSLTMVFLYASLIIPLAGERAVSETPLIVVGPGEMRRAVTMLREGNFDGLLHEFDPSSFPEGYRDFMLYLKGLAAYEMGVFEIAEKYRNELSSSFPGSFFTGYLNVESAYYLVGEGRYGEARERVDRVAGEPAFYLEGSRYFYVRGRLDLKDGAVLKGVKGLLECVKRYPGTTPSMEAEKILVPLVVEKGMKEGSSAFARISIELGNALIGGGKFDGAARVLSTYRKNVRGITGGELDLVLANALRRAGRYTDAINLLREEGRGEPVVMRAEKLFFAGLYSWYRGRVGDAEKMLKEVIEVYGGSDSHYRAAFNLARIYEEGGRFNDAHYYYGIAADAGEAHIKAEASFRRGLVKFLTSMYGEAEKIFTANLDTFLDEGSFYRNLFMRGYSLEKKGEGERAKRVYEEILSKREGGLYYFLSLMKLGKFPGWSVFHKVEFKDITPEGFLTHLLNEPGRRGKQVSVHMERSIVFQRLGLYAFSLEELRKIDRENLLPRGVSGTARDAVFAYLSGDFRKAISLTYSPGFSSKFKGIDFLKSGSYMQYPALRFIITRDERGKPDPFFLHSIFRQESLFDYSAISPAGAVGLGQIMPQTGRRLAGELSLGRYRKELLFDPMTNALFSRAYLKKLLAIFQGSPVLAAAGYNAGEGAAKRWQTKGGGDQFLYQELIGYEETRKYVRRVFMNYLNYLKLYGAGWENIVTGR